MKEMREEKRRKESRSRSPSSKPTTPTATVTNVTKVQLPSQPLGLKNTPKTAALAPDLVPFAHKTIHPLMDNITELDSEGEKSTVKCAPHAAGAAADDQQSLLDLMNASRTDLPMQREILDDLPMRSSIGPLDLDPDAVLLGRDAGRPSA